MAKCQMLRPCGMFRALCGIAVLAVTSATAPGQLQRGSPLQEPLAQLIELAEGTEDAAREKADAKGENSQSSVAFLPAHLENHTGNGGLCTCTGHPEKENWLWQKCPSDVVAQATAETLVETTTNAPNSTDSELRVAYWEDVLNNRMGGAFQQLSDHCKFLSLSAGDVPGTANEQGNVVRSIIDDGWKTATCTKQELNRCKSGANNYKTTNNPPDHCPNQCRQTNDPWMVVCIAPEVNIINSPATFSMIPTGKFHGWTKGAQRCSNGVLQFEGATVQMVQKKATVCSRKSTTMCAAGENGQWPMSCSVDKFQNIQVVNITRCAGWIKDHCGDSAVLECNAVRETIRWDAEQKKLVAEGIEQASLGDLTRVIGNTLIASIMTM